MGDRRSLNAHGGRRGRDCGGRNAGGQPGDEIVGVNRLAHTHQQEQGAGECNRPGGEADYRRYQATPGGVSASQLGNEQHGEEPEVRGGRSLARIGDPSGLRPAPPEQPDQRRRSNREAVVNHEQDHASPWPDQPFHRPGRRRGGRRVMMSVVIAAGTPCRTKLLRHALSPLEKSKKTSIELVQPVSRSLPRGPSDDQKNVARNSARCRPLCRKPLYRHCLSAMCVPALPG